MRLIHRRSGVVIIHLRSVLRSVLRRWRLIESSADASRPGIGAAEPERKRTGRPV